MLWSTRSAATPPIGLEKKEENVLSDTLYTDCLQQHKFITTFKALYKCYAQTRSQELVRGADAGFGGVDPSAQGFLRFSNKNNAFLGIIRLKFLL